MSISKTMCDALNKHFNEELNSAYIYDSMAAYFLDASLKGFSGWMTVQASEERMHAQKIQDYLDDHGQRVYHASMSEPKTEWNSTLEAFKDALKHERHISKCIHNLVHMARGEKDLPTEAFLAWYVDEQVEEEANAQSVIDKLTLIGDSGVGIYLLDREISDRKAD